jgi:hypothetical protein
VSEPHQVAAEVRRARRVRRLGSDRAACALCGETEPAVLNRASRRLIEFHHLAAWVNDPELGVFLCLTHHGLLTELMRAGIPLDRVAERSDMERLAAVLRGTALYADLQAEAFRRWADIVEAREREQKTTDPGGQQ